MKILTQQLLKRALLAGAAIAPALAFAPMSVNAQTTEEAGEDVIIVSARRRNESLQEVPIAVTAVSAEQLDNLGAVDITAIQRLTPNATIETARGSNSTLIAFIRGIGQQDPLWGFEPGVGVYVDDVFLARPQGAVLDIFDIERIEVLRGPQGTLYGRNTVGGAIKYVTKSLNMEEAEFRARINVGSYGQFDQVVSGSYPLSDTFAVGGALANFQRDGFGQNLNTGAEHYNKDILAGRISAQWMPNDAWTFRLSADRTEDSSDAKHGHRLLPSADGSFAVTGNVYDTRAGLGDDNSVENQGASLTATWQMNDMVTFKSVTAYRESETATPIDFDALPQQDFDVPATYEDNQFSQELQVLFERDRVSGVAGLYYLDGDAKGDFDVVLSSFGLTIYQSGEQQKENFSAFADVSFELNDQWSASVGGRYTQDETTADVNREVWLGLGSGAFDAANTGSIFLVRQTGYDNLTRKDEEFTPRVSLSYAPHSDLNLYAAYSEGFKAGGFDPRAREDLDPTGLSREGFGPEKVKSYEVGAKGRAFDGALTYATALFFADYTDQQITVQEGVDTDNDNIADSFVSTVFNAGVSEYYGVEIEGAWQVSDAFALTGILGYINADIKEIISAGVDISDGFTTQNTPEWTGRLGANYRFDMSNNRGSVVLNASTSYRDKYNLFNVANSGFAPGANATFPDGGPALDPDQYYLIDASIAWTSPDDKWKAGLYGRNLSGEEYKVAAYNFVTPNQLGADSAYSAFYGAPRTFTASLEYRY